MDFETSRKGSVGRGRHGQTRRQRRIVAAQEQLSDANVWQYRGVNTTRAGRMEESALHATVKPVQIIADAIQWRRAFP
jgi:hypothetical protein